MFVCSFVCLSSSYHWPEIGKAHGHWHVGAGALAVHRFSACVFFVKPALPTK